MCDNHGTGWLTIYRETEAGRDYVLTFGKWTAAERLADATPGKVGYQGHATLDEAIRDGRRFIDWPTK